MSKAVRSTFTSDAGAEEVFRTLTSPDWPDRKAAELSDGSSVVRREEKADGGLLFVVSRELPSGVPGFLERFLPQDGRVVQTDDWGPALPDGTRRGTWQVDIPGAPAKLGGTMRLDPTAGGSSYVIEGEATVRVPVVGGKAESFIAGMVEKLAAKEADLLTRTLSS